MLVSDNLDHLREIHKTFRLVYEEVPPEEEIEALRCLPGVNAVECEGRGVRLRVRGDTEAVYRALEARPYEVRDVDGIGMSLEDIFIAYVEEGVHGR